MEKREYGLECIKCGARFSAPAGRGKRLCPRCEQDVCGKCRKAGKVGDTREQHDNDGWIGGNE